MRPTRSKCDSQRPLYRDVNLQIIFGISLMAVMGFSIIPPAFPRIVQELKISPQEVGLLISAYTLPAIVFILVLGVLADRFGRKKVLVPSLFLFGIAGTACAFARDFNLLLLLRFFQGLGGSSAFPLGLTIIGDIYSGEECTKALGYNFGASHVANAIYPFIGGAVAMLAWYYPFFLSILAIPIGLSVLFFLKNPEPKKEQHMREYLSDVFRGMENRRVVGIFICAIMGFIVFSGAYLTYFPLLIGGRFTATPLVIGLIISSGYVFAAISSSQTSRLSKYCSKRNLIKVSFLLFALALVIVPLLTDLWLIVIPAIVFGFALGVNDTSMVSVLTGSVSPKCRAAFMSMEETFLMVGMTFGPLLMGVIFVTFGVEGIFYAGAILSIVAFMVASAMIR